MPVNLANIRDNLKEAFPDAIFYVCKYTLPGGTCSYYGKKLLRIQLDDGDWLDVYKLSDSSGYNMNDDVVKQKAFPFVYDTRNITDSEIRRDRLGAHLKNIFPDHNVNVFIYGNVFENAYHSRGNACFRNGYGSSVTVVLS